MADRLSKAKMEQLGKRLVVANEPAAGDRALLHEILLTRSAQLESAIARVRDELGLVPTSRVKNTGTILEKLRRQGGWTLASMQDLAGMRVVGDFDRNGQDVVVSQLCELFADQPRPPKVIDRRAAPMHGYSAVHVIVFPAGEPIEIQVRTPRQHEWAELFEKLADLVGRGIRYGEPPRPWAGDRPVDDVAPELLATYADTRDQTIAATLELSELISSLEQLESADEPDLDMIRDGMDSLIALARGAVEQFEEIVRQL